MTTGGDRRDILSQTGKLVSRLPRGFVVFVCGPKRSNARAATHDGHCPGLRRIRQSAQINSRFDCLRGTDLSPTFGFRVCLKPSKYVLPNLIAYIVLSVCNPFSRPSFDARRRPTRWGLKQKASNCLSIVCKASQNAGTMETSVGIGSKSVKVRHLHQRFET